MKTNKVKIVMRNLLIVIVILLLSNTVYSQKQSCKAELTVENNINSKKASAIGTSYRLSLINQEDIPVIYFIEVKNSENNKIENNIDFRVNFIEINTNNSKKHNFQKNINSVYQIKLDKDETFNFIIELLNNNASKIGDKNITEVIVTSDKCKNTSVSKKLFTEIVKTNIIQH